MPLVNVETKKHYSYIFILLTIILVLLVQYYGYFAYDYSVPAGEDSVNHARIANYILRTGQLERSYLPGWHLLSASLSLVTGLDTITLYKIFVPLITILFGFVIYTFLKQVGYEKIAPLGFFLATIAAKHPLMTINDGGYPNVLANYIFLPLFFLYFYKTYNAKNNWKKIIAILFGVTVIIFHQLTGYYFIFITLPLIIILFLIEKIRKIKNKQRTAQIITVIIATYLFIFIPFYRFYIAREIQTINNLLNAVFKSTIGVDLNITEQTTALRSNEEPLPLHFYDNYIGSLPVLISLLFFVIFLWDKIFKLQKNKQEEAEKEYVLLIILLLWLGMMFCASRTSMFIWPARFNRDLSVPLVIIAALTIYYLINKLKNRKIRLALVALTLIFCAQATYSYITDYTAKNKLVRLDPIDYQTMEWLKNNSQPKDVIVSGPYYGVFIEAITGRETVWTFSAGQYHLGLPVNDIIYRPYSLETIKLLAANSIDYYYINTRPYDQRSPMEYKNFVPALKTVRYLKEIKKVNDPEGEIIIYQIDQQVLANLLRQQTKN